MCKKATQVNLLCTSSMNTLTVHSVRPSVLDVESWMEWEERCGILNAQIKRKQAEERCDRESNEQRKGKIRSGKKRVERGRSLVVICCCSAASRCVPPTDL